MPSRPLWRRVGPLQRLAVFEAAARLGTFTAAAAELGMTQPGVTRQVRALEARLGRRLFERRANRALLNEDGARLLEAVAQGFAAIEHGLERIAADSGDFVLAANQGVALRWLVPHVDGLQAVLAGRDLRLWLFDRNAELAAGSFDAAIHVGDGRWPQWRSRLLFEEIVVPVATAACAARLGLDRHTAPASLRDKPLLHLDEHDRPWMSWRDWFRHHGVEPPAGTRRVSYNNYALVLGEALAGHGVALGWRYLIDEELARGTLVTVGPEAASTRSGYYLLWSPEAREASVQRLAAWLDALLGR